MQVNLKSFVDQAMSTKESHALYVNEQGVHDTGKVGTAFTRSETFRKTTKAFLSAFTAEYGDKIGDLATKLLHENLEAGKPLTAATVKQIVDFGDAQRTLKLDYLRTQDQRLSRAGNDLDGIILGTDKAADFLKRLSGTPQQTFTDQQIRLLQETVNHCRPALLAGAHLIDGDFLDNLAQRVRDGRVPFFSKAADLILQNPQAPEANLAHEGIREHINSPAYAPDLSLLQWDNAWTDETLSVAEEKLHILMMIEPDQTDRVDQDMLVRVCAALPKLRAAHPQTHQANAQTFDPHTPIGDLSRPRGTTFTQADIFNAVFPPKSTPTMHRPTDDELNRFSATELKSYLQEARRDFFDHFHASHLPLDSPFRGPASSQERPLAQAKNLGVSPATLLSLTGTHVTLKDLPEMQALNRINLTPLNGDDLNADLCRAFSLNGTQGLALPATPPTLTFKRPDGTQSTHDLGPLPMTGQPLNPDQIDYRDGKPGAIFHAILAPMNDLPVTPKQAELLRKTLGSEGKIPLLQVMNALRDGADIGEFDTFNYLVEQQDNGDLTVTLSTGDNLAPFVGKASLTYTVSHLETVEISDFQWDAPTLDARKQALLTDERCSCSIPALLQETARAAHLSDAAAKSFTDLAAVILKPIIEQANAMEDLPSAEALKALLPPHEHAMPELKAFLALVQAPAFQQTNDSGKQRLMDTILGALKLLTRQVNHPISQNAEDLFLDFGLNHLLKAIDLRAQQGLTTDPSYLTDLVAPDSPTQLMLTAVESNLHHADCYLRARCLPPEDRMGFLQATALFHTPANTQIMNLFMNNRQGLTLLAQQNQPMTREQAWDVLFHAQPPMDLPYGSTIPEDNRCEALLFNQLTNNLMQQALQARQTQRRDPGLAVTNAYTLLDTGLKPTIINTYLRGEQLPEKITDQMMQPYGGLCSCSQMVQPHEAVQQLDRDLPRTFGIVTEQPDGTLVTRIPSTLSLNLPAHGGLPPVTLQFNPQKPPVELQSEQIPEDPQAETVTTTPPQTTARKLANLLLQFCGEDHQEQVTSVLLAMSQAGRSPENVKYLFGEYPNRNVPLDLSVNADQDGNIHVKRTNVNGARLTCGWDIIVRPDGTQRLQGFHMERTAQ